MRPTILANVSFTLLPYTLLPELIHSKVNLDGLSEDDIVNLLNASYTLPNPFGVPSFGEASESVDDTQSDEYDSTIDAHHPSIINSTLFAMDSEPLELLSSGLAAPLDMMSGRSVSSGARAH